MGHYHVLGVKPDDSFQVIKSAYMRLALECHPDRNPQEATKFKSIQCAYDELSDFLKEQQTVSRFVDELMELSSKSSEQL